MVPPWNRHGTAMVPPWDRHGTAMPSTPQYSEALWGHPSLTPGTNTIIARLEGHEVSEEMARFAVELLVRLLEREA